MASTNLGRVQGAGMFTTTAASGTSISLSAISPTNISPLVGDSVIFPNGDVRSVTAVSGGTITCGDVVTNITGPQGQQGQQGPQGDGTVVQINGVNQTTMNFISTESTMESPDGTYICFIKATWAATTNKSNYTVTFPEPFLSAPSVVITPQTTQGIAFGVNNITTTSATLYIYGVTSQDVSTGVNIVAIGRKAA